jgi:hypothetical protein
MLTTATIGMAAYGLYAAVSALAGASRLEIWIVVLEVLFAALLVLASAFVRVSVPGGLALATGAMLGLQALAIHDAAHLYGAIAVAPQVARGLLAATLVLLGWIGGRHGQGRVPWR